MSNTVVADLDIRRFRSGDGERIRDVHESAMAETPEYVPDVPDEDLHAIEKYYGDDEEEFLVGVVNDEIVGTGAYTRPNAWKEKHIEIGRKTAELTRMRVAPEWQARGIGSALYYELERRARSDGYQRFVLDTGAENERARGFYERLDFECREEIAVDFGEMTLQLALYENPIDKRV